MHFYLQLTACSDCSDPSKAITIVWSGFSAILVDILTFLMVTKADKTATDFNPTSSLSSTDHGTAQNWLTHKLQKSQLPRLS